MTDSKLVRNIKLRNINQIIAAKGIVVVTITITIGGIWMMSKLGLNIGVIFCWIIGVLLSTLPAIYLHLQYLFCNKNEVYEFYSNMFIRLHSESSTIYYCDDIQDVVIYLSNSVKQKSKYQLTTFDQYHFARITMKSGETIIITCLLIEYVEDIIKVLDLPKKYRRKTRIFCNLQAH